MKKTYWVRVMQWNWEWGKWIRIPRGTYEDMIMMNDSYRQLKEVDEKDLVPYDEQNV